MGRKLDDKNETVLKQYVRDSGMTFDEICNRGEYGFSRDTITRALRNPARTSKQTYLKIAERVGMDIDEAGREWNESRKIHILEREGLI